MKIPFTFFMFLIAIICQSGVNKPGPVFITEINENNNKGFVPISLIKAPSFLEDSLALVELYNSTGGPNWTNHTNWLTPAPLNTWYGITLQAVSRRVLALSLNSNNLIGSIPASIDDLSQLTNIELISNHLSGTIPASIGNLVNLQGLRFDDNQLTGTIPISITNLTQLTWLSLRVNQLTGTIPEQIGNLTNMFNLQLDLNQLSGTIPASIGNMSNLNILGLHTNQLSGSIPPSIGSLTHLTQLRLDDNQLSGVIPDELGNINASSGLAIYFNINQLTGTIPASIGNIPNLIALAINDNQLTGEIPASFANLTQLTLLHLNNNQLSGSLSPLSSLTGLTYLLLQNNKFTFEGLEPLVQQVSAFGYAPQANIPIHIADCKLSVTAGGTMANNTYKWYRNNQLVATITGDSTYPIILGGDYKVMVTNSIATQLTLASDLLLGILPKPEMGPPKLQLFCPITYANISHLFDDVLNAHPEYIQIGWFTISGIPTNPTLATFGTSYMLIVQNIYGCRDTGIVNTATFPILNILPAQPQTVLAMSEVTDTSGWTHYYSAGNKLLLSLKKNGNNIGTIGNGTFQVKVGATSGAGSGTAYQVTSPLFTNTSASFVMNRYWDVTPTTQPTSSVGVRFYYTTEDFADLRGSVPGITSHLQMHFYKLYGGNPDPVTNFATATDIIDLSSGANPSPTSWVYTFLGCNEHQSEYQVDNFSGGGGGATINGSPFAAPAVPPVITNVSPLIAASNATVSISGNNFNATTSVSFGGIDAASFTVVTPTTISAIVGNGASGNVSVTTSAGTSSFAGFNFVSPQGISFNPMSGPVGTAVVITGNNFSSTPGNNIVYFGAVKAVVSAASSTTLTVTVPPGASYQPITVTTNNLTVYSAKPFMVTFPGGGTGFTSASFDSYVNFSTGAYPSHIIVDDINVDGKPDLITANYGINADGNSISILKNTSTTGVISFAGKIDLLTGSGPWTTATGDLDGDGRHDLVVANESSNTISVFRNTSTAGNISFAAKLDFVTGDLPESVIIRDLDGDGKPDIIVTNYLSNTVSVFKNTSTVGSILLNPKSDFTTGSVPISITIADADGDNKPDLLIANNSSSTVSILRNTSTGGTISFAAKVDLATGINPWTIAVADLNEDGKLDIAVSNAGTNTFSVLRNTGSSGIISFAAKQDFTTDNGPTGLSINDLNGDGKPDIAISYNGVNPAVSVFRNNSLGGAVSFDAKVNVVATADSYSLSAGDLDGDGKPDLAVTNLLQGIISTLRNKTGEAELCSGGSTTITADLTGASYQWQVNTGSGFSSISNNGNYAGTNTKVLLITNAPSAWYGYQYRCLVNTVAGNISTLKISNYWTGAASTAWENPLNWSCGILPDINTDVFINAGTVRLNSNAACRSLTLKTTAVLTIKTGFNLSVTY